MTNSNSIFYKYDVFLAHCLTKLGGAGNTNSNNKNIYERINHTVKTQSDISCSTIKHGDTLEYLQVANFFGPVGLILNNVIVYYANEKDAGTYVLKNDS